MIEEELGEATRGEPREAVTLSHASKGEPKISRQRARGAALRALVDRAFGGALGGMMSHLVEDEKLTKKQRDELRRMLEEGK